MAGIAETNFEYEEVFGVMTCRDQVVRARATFEMSVPALETTAVAVTARGQSSIIPCGNEANDGRPVSLRGEGAAPFFFAQQSCDFIDAQELPATTVSERARPVSVLAEAVAPLLHPKRQPAPAIHRETLTAINQRNDVLVKSHLMLAEVYLGLTSTVEIARDYLGLE